VDSVAGFRKIAPAINECGRRIRDSGSGFEITDRVDLGADLLRTDRLAAVSRAEGRDVA
jgi:hypothetical protein